MRRSESYLNVLVIVALALLIAAAPCRGEHKNLASNYWVDGACGSDGNTGTSENKPFATFRVLSELLPLSSALNVSIWVSPGTYTLDRLDWPYSMSLKIAKCDGNCPICSTNSGPVRIEISYPNTLIDDSAFRQLAPTGIVDPAISASFALKGLEIVNTGPPWKFDVIVLSRANSIFEDVFFSEITLDSRASLITFVNQSDIAFRNCKWQNISSVGNICESLLVHAKFGGKRTSIYTPDIVTTFLMEGCSISNVQAKKSSLRFESLFLINSDHVSISNSSFHHIVIPIPDLFDSGTLFNFQQDSESETKLTAVIHQMTVYDVHAPSIGSMIQFTATSADIQVQNCSFESNEASIINFKQPQAFPTSIGITFKILGSSFVRNRYGMKLLSITDIKSFEMIDCEFLANQIRWARITDPLVFVKSEKVLMMRNFVVGRDTENSGSDGIFGHGISLVGEHFVVHSLNFSDCVDWSGGELLRFGVLPHEAMRNESYVLKISDVSFTRIYTSLDQRGSQLLSFNLIPDLGTYPTLTASGIFFEDIFFADPSQDNIQNVFISAYQLPRVKLSNIRISNSTIPKLTHTTDTIAFFSLKFITDVTLEDVTIKDSLGKVIIEDIENTLTLRRIIVSGVNATQVVSVRNFANAHVEDVRFQNILGTAMYWSAGKSVFFKNAEFNRCHCATGDGGGLALAHVKNLQFQGCVFTENFAFRGGALAAFGRSIEYFSVLSSVFEGNTAAQDGGALRVESGFVKLNNCSFNANRANDGSGGAILAITPHISASSTFKRNSATVSGGAISYLLPSTQPTNPTRIIIHLYNSAFIGNSAGIHGGAVFVPMIDNDLSSAVEIYLDRLNASKNSLKKPLEACKRGIVDIHRSDDGFGGFMHSPCTKYLVVNNSNFEANSATSGGVFYIHGNTGTSHYISALYFLNSNYTNNCAEWRGGAIYLQSWNSHQEFQSNIVTRNSAFQGGFLHTLFTPLWFFNPNNKTAAIAPYNQFISNTAIEGGVLFFNDGNYFRAPVFSGQLFESNSAKIGGIAVSGGYSFDSSLFLSPCAPSNICFNNTAYGYGPEIASLSANFVFEQETWNNVKFPQRMYSTPYEIHGKLFDMYGQLCDYGARSKVRAKIATKPSNSSLSMSPEPQDYPQTIFSPLMADSYVQDGRVSINLWPLNRSPHRQIAYLTLEFESLYVALHRTLDVGGCPSGMGMDDTYGCVPCPSGEFSLTEDVFCLKCPKLPHLTCIGGKVLTSRGHWVASNSKRDSIVPVLCPYPDICLGKSNECSHGKTGFLCASCKPGLSESWTSSCSVCDGPNWPLIVMAFILLWLVTILLHILISRSSGKATSLVYFLQTTYFLIGSLPLSPFLHAITGKESSPTSSSMRESKFVNFVLCFFPMDIFQRQLLISSVPFIMAFQISLTFAIYHASVVPIRFCTWLFRKQAIPSNAPGSTSLSNLDGYISQGEGEFSSQELGRVEQDLTVEIYNDEISVGLAEESDLNSGGFQFVEGDDNDEYSMDATEADRLISNSFPADQNITLAKLRQVVEETTFFHRYRLTRSLVYFASQSIVSVMGFAMIFAYCSTIPGLDLDPYMAKAPSESCRGTKFKRWRMGLILMVPWIVAVFAFVAFRLFYGKWNGVLSNVDSKYGVLYEMFRPKFFYWKLVEIFRRFVLTLPLLAGSSPAERSNMNVVLMIIIFIAQIIAKPYAQRLENGLAASSLAALILISLIVTWNPNNDPVLLQVLPAVVLGITILFSLAFCIAIIRATVRKVPKTA